MQRLKKTGERVQGESTAQPLQIITFTQMPALATSIPLLEQMHKLEQALPLPQIPPLEKLHLLMKECKMPPLLVKETPLEKMGDNLLTQLLHPSNAPPLMMCPHLKYAASGEMLLYSAEEWQRECVLSKGKGWLSPIRVLPEGEVKTAIPLHQAGDVGLPQHPPWNSNSPLLCRIHLLKQGFPLSGGASLPEARTCSVHGENQLAHLLIQQFPGFQPLPAPTPPEKGTALGKYSGVPRLFPEEWVLLKMGQHPGFQLARIGDGKGDALITLILHPFPPAKVVGAPPEEWWRAPA